MDRGDIIKNILGGYISYKKGIPLKKSLEFIQKCSQYTTKKLNISDEDVEDVIYSPRFISVFSWDIPRDKKRMEYLMGEGFGSSTESINELSYLPLELFIPPNYETMEGYEKGEYIIDNEDEIEEIGNVFRPSKEWIYSQKKYTESLSMLDKLIINAYTARGDQLVNDYLRAEDKSVNFGYGPNEHVYFVLVYEYKDQGGKEENFAKFLYEKLQSIIAGSPPVDRDFITYRGKQILSRDDKKGDIIRQQGFSSTTLDLYSGMEYADPKSISKTKSSFEYVEKIIIPKGSRVLLIKELSTYPEDPEILLPHNSRFQIIEKCKKKSFYHTGGTIYGTGALENVEEVSGKVCLIEYIP